jgi:malonyl-CoA O-methyltransferase
MRRVEFYLCDAMQVSHFAPVLRALRGLGADAVFVSARGDANAASAGWYDADVAESLAKKLGLPVVPLPNPHADIAVTTERAEILRDYRKLRVRMMYGVNLLGIFSNTPEAHVGFDLYLVHGQFNRRLSMQFVRADQIRIMGHPRFDAWFNKSLQPHSSRKEDGARESKPAILYAPTWGEQRSSIEGFADSLFALSKRFEILVRPHHCTYRMEPARMAKLVSGPTRMLAPSMPLEEAFALADIVIADISSGVFPDAIFMNKKVLGLARKEELDSLLLPAIKQHFPFCLAPEQLPQKVDEALGLNNQSPEIREIRRDMFETTDGADAVRAAQAIMAFMEDDSHRPWRSVKRAMTWQKGRVLNVVRHNAVLLRLRHPHPRQLAAKVLPRPGWAGIPRNLKPFGPGCLSSFNRAGARRVADAVQARRPRNARTGGSPAGALGWLRAHARPDGGMRVHSGHEAGYQEVTGYLIPTLLVYGERDLARRAAAWLVDVQRPDGAFCDPDHGQPYVFDTGQALRGLLAALDLEPGARAAARAAADFLVGQMDAEGAFPEAYSQIPYVPETIHLYALPPLREAGAKLSEERYAAAAERALGFYLHHPQLLDLDSTLTHFLAYEIEALIDLGRGDAAASALDRLAAMQGGNGAVRAIGGTRWVCAPGLAQIAVCWLQTGRSAPAERALAWMEAHQEPSGGWHGGYGLGAWYFPDVEPAWVPKYYLDAHLLRLASYFDRNAEQFPDAVRPDDGRLQAIVAATHAGDRVLESGCGKGRFLAGLRAAVPDLSCAGVDLSEALLSHLPAGVTRLRGTIENLPCAEASFDVVFSVEAIEHSANAEAAVREMIRVARPGGRVLVVDKQHAHWGRLATPAWERWPDRDAVAEWLAAGCDDVRVEEVGYDGQPADGLMLAWSGVKHGKAR